MIVTGSCHLRIEPPGNITVCTLLSCFLLSLPAFTRKHGFPPTKILHVLQNISPVKNQSPRKDVFLSTVHSVPVCCLFGFTSKRCTCNSQTRRHFPAMFYFCFCRCFLYVSTHPKHHHGEPGILSMCAFVLFTSLVCDSLTIAFASAAISRSRHTLREHELMKNMSDKIHGYQSS